MIVQRRNFLIGLASLLAAPAIVRAENIMPVRAIILPVHDPLVRGVRFQSWAFGTKKPGYYCTGTIGPESGRGVLKPLSHFLKHVDAHRQWYPDLCWQPFGDDKYASPGG